VLGLLLLAVELWVQGRWALGGGARPVHSAPYSISAARKVVLWAWQALVITGCVSCAAYLIRQCRRQRKLTFEAALFASFILMDWVAPVVQFAGPVMVVNKYAINVSDWGGYIPGWHGLDAAVSPIGIFSSDLLALGLALPWFWASRWILDRACGRRRSWRLGTLIAVALVSNVVMDAAFESVWILTGSWAYGSADPGPALFGGHWYHVPVIEFILMGAYLAILVVMDRRARDRGTEPVLLNGIDRLPVRLRPLARFLAVSGLATLMLLAWAVILAAALSGASHHLNPDLPGYLTPSP
jgi:hypothetical protein